MFMDYTLCPGGAFIQCESVAAFDPNMPTDVTPEVQDQIVTELKPQVEYYQRVDKVLHILSGIADQVLDLYDLPFTEDREENMAKLDQVGDLAAEIANCMIMMVTKIYAMYTALNTEKFVYEPVNSNLGYFIKNISEFRRQGRTKLQSECLCCILKHTSMSFLIIRSISTRSKMLLHILIMSIWHLRMLEILSTACSMIRRDDIALRTMSIFSLISTVLLAPAVFPNVRLQASLVR